VDGFTAYVDQATAVDDDLVEAVRAYHVIRSEMRNTAVVDFEGLRIQYQGDRMQVLAYLPLDDEEEAAVRAVRAAAALNSVVTDVLPQVIGEAAKPLAIGLAAGTALVSKLGERGNRDVVSLGSATVEAARIQVGLDGEEIGLDAELYGRLPDWLQQAFAWRKSPGAYVAAGLTLDELERLEAAESPGRAKTLLAAGTGLALGVGAAALARRRSERTEPPLRPWHPDA
jgi:class 3 adenylate cyclase